MDRRGFLKRAGAGLAAGALAMAGVARGADSRPKETERKDNPETSREKDIRKIEANIFSSFDPKDLKDVGSGVIPDKVHMFSKLRNEAVAKTTISAVGTAVTSAVAYGAYRQRENERKSLDKPQSPKGPDVPLGAAVLGVAGLGLTAVMAKDWYKQHPIENIEDAERRVVDWIQDYNVNKTKVEDSSEESVKKAIKALIGKLGE